jgi:hypothetical protein
MKKKYFMVAIVVIFIILLFVIIWRMNRSKPSVSNIVEAKENSIQPPSNIVVESENGTIFAKWDSVKGAEKYIMYYSNKSGFKIEEGRSIENITEGLFRITKVPPGTYYYRVASIKGDLKSPISEEYSITVGKCKPPSAPREVVASANPSDPSEVTISWTPDTTGDGYVLYVNADVPPTGHEGNTLEIKIDDPSITEHSLQGVSSGKWYVSVANMSTYCGLGELSAPVELN